MFETLDKMMLAGLGALSISREKAEQLFDEYVNRGQAEKSKKSGFVKEVMDTAEKTRSSLEELISKQLSETLGRLNLATKEDIKRIEEKLDELLKKGQ